MARACGSGRHSRSSDGFDPFAVLLHRSLRVVGCSGCWSHPIAQVFGLEIDLLERIDELNNYKIVSLLITGLAGYFFYFFLVFIQHFRINKVVKEIIQVLAYLSVVMLWRTVWDGNIFYEMFFNITKVHGFKTNFQSFVTISIRT